MCLRSWRSRGFEKVRMRAEVWDCGEREKRRLLESSRQWISLVSTVYVMSCSFLRSNDPVEPT